MIRQEVKTYTVAIYIAGDAADARRICREFCMSGLCVTVEPVEFIYTGGAEAGVRIGLINYPRFPAEPASIFAKAEELAHALIVGLCQSSASVVATDRTAWLSRRDDLPVAPEARSTAPSPSDGEGAQQIGEADRKPTEPNPKGES